MARSWRPPGQYVVCDVNLSSDPAIMRAGPMAELLFRRGNEHIKRNRRDGDLYTAELPVIGAGIATPGKHAKALVREGLWVATEEGWHVRSFLKWNMSQAEIDRRSDEKRRAAAASNHAQGRHKNAPNPDCPVCEEDAA